MIKLYINYITYTYTDISFVDRADVQRARIKRKTKGRLYIIILLRAYLGTRYTLYRDRDE